MKYLLLIPVLVLSFSCATADDIRGLASEIEGIKAIANSLGSTGKELRVALEDFEEEVEEVAERVEKRGDDADDALTEAMKDGGVLGSVGLIGLHLFRNGSRKKELDVKENKKIA